MDAHAPTFRLRSAFAAALALFAAAVVLLRLADDATDIAAIAAGTGIVVSGALLGLSVLVWRWRIGTDYVESDVIGAARREASAAATDEPRPAADDAAAV